MGMFDDLIPGQQQPQRAGMFDDLVPKADPQIGNPQPLTFAEKYLAPALSLLGDSLQRDPGLVGSVARGVLNDGNARGAPLGRVAQGAADPGVAIAQLAANAAGQGQSVNKAIADEEQQYQAARKEAGSSGIDPLRLAGQAGITMMAPGATGGAGVVRGAAMGAAAGAATPLSDNPENYWATKAKQVGMGAATGAVLSPVLGALARVVSPNASTNANVQLLQKEGIDPSIGQTLGGAANALEEKAQSLPIVGPFIQRARGAGADQLREAAFARTGVPVEGDGYAAVSDAASKLGQKYEELLPKLSVNVTDPQFVDRMASLRSMVQQLPKQEADQFDSVISREIDGRVMPDGNLSGQALKDAWNALRDKAALFGKSDDAYQSQLGSAFKQAFQELKDQVTATNSGADVSALRNLDLGYANFKRVQRAASSLGAEDGNFSPAQLQNAVRALDTSKDKARFATGDALMQDLSGAGKSVLTNKLPNPTTADRVMLGAVLTGTAPVALPAAAVGAAAYTPQIQNVLRALVSQRPEMAPAVANYLRRLVGPAALAGVPALEQGQR